VVRVNTEDLGMPEPLAEATLPGGLSRARGRIRPTRRGLLALGLLGSAIVPVGVSIAASPATATTRVLAASCANAPAKLDGGPVANYCGPATATLVIGGKTYKYKDGLCQAIKVSGIKVDVTLGSIAEGKSGAGAPGNAKQPYFRLDLSPGQFSSVLDGAFSGGQRLVPADEPSVTPSGFSTKGTFTSQQTAGGGVSFSGSWNCHGSIAKH
jgi:hypothetical protein